MIEENKNINEDRIDAYPIPQEAVILDDKKVLDLSQVVMLAIKQIIKDRGISLKIKKKGKNMSTLTRSKNPEKNPRVKAIFDDIKSTRGSDFINNLWYII